MKRPHEQAYVAIGESGLLKVGRTTKLDKRVQQLKKEFKAKGDRFLHLFACPPLEAGYSVESSLIGKCGELFKQHSGREWFVNGNYSVIFAELLTQYERWKTHSYGPMQTAEDKARAAARYAVQRAEKLAEAERYREWRDSNRRRIKLTSSRGRPARVFDWIVSACTPATADEQARV